MRRIYNFRQWFDSTPGDDGKVRFVLVRGVHYECSQSSMVQQLRVAATHCGVRVCLVDLGESVSVCVVPKPEPRTVVIERVAESESRVADSESPTVVVPFARMTNVDRS